MRTSARPVRDLLLRSMWLSAAFALVLMGAFFTLFSYDLEDVIFNRLVAAEADRPEPGHLPGITTYSGQASLPPWLRERLEQKTSQGEYEIPTEGHGHFHVAVRPGAANGTPGMSRSTCPH